ncbi:hypothetical protein AaE_006465 [Aphanomyces astaci]|uniref:Uncharacterized protein n=1 Tax=Aphanomyces astaci TaxID=112090 RepID=A0A6A5AEZ7_APHAT|nr:hypothetical protein AaE_006465 [Aphanomyces astaci]
MSPKDSISAMVEEAMADTYLHGMLLATPHDAIEATASALPHLVRSIRVLEGCALHHTRQQQADPLSQDNDDDDDNDGDDDDDNGDDVAEFMQEEVLRLKLKHCSACLHLATLYLDTNMHAKMLTSLADACMFMPVDAVPAHPRHVLLSVITSLDFFSTLATELDFGGAAASSTRSYKSSNGSSKQCQSMAHARACVLEVIGDAANVLDTNDTPTAAALFHAFAVVSGGLLPSHCYDHQASVASVWVKQHSAAASSMVSTDTAESLRYMAFFAYLNALEPQVPADSFLYVYNFAHIF